MEGQVTFLETEVGAGSTEHTAHARDDLKITGVKATGVYSGTETRPHSKCTVHLRARQPGQADRKDSVLAWNGAVTRYEVTSTAANGYPSRSDRPLECVSQTNYIIESPRGMTPWSSGPIASGRHDSAAYLAQYGTQGAIFDRVTPSFSYNRTDASVKAVANHVFDALYAPQLTYPQKNDKDIPGNIWNGEWQPLHRNYPGFDAASADVATKNRTAKDRACAGLASNPGEQCDEFPFASTKEGAGLGDGNFSVRYVPQPDNSTAGARLSAWYGQERILDGEPYGIFVN